MFLRALSLSKLDEESEPPGRYDAEARCRLDEHGRPCVLDVDVSRTRTETKAMRDPSDSDEDRCRSAARIAFEASDDHSSSGLTVTKTGGGRDTDRPRSASALMITNTRGARDRD